MSVGVRQNHGVEDELVESGGGSRGTSSSRVGTSDVECGSEDGGV
jgi:hypothetical protein